MDRVIFSNPGVGVDSATLPNGTPIVSVKIDNPTGAWLYVVNERSYIAPYTLDWATTLEFQATSVSVEAGDGPSGQLGTITGDVWQLTISDEPVAASGGVAAPEQYIGTSQEIKLLQYEQVVPLSTGISLTPMLAGITGKRFRVFNINAGLGEQVGYPASTISQTVLRFYQSNLLSSQFFTLISLTPSLPWVPVAYPQNYGLLLDVNTGISLLVTTAWANVYITLSIYYAIV